MSKRTEDNNEDREDTGIVHDIENDVEAGEGENEEDEREDDRDNKDEKGDSEHGNKDAPPVQLSDPLISLGILQPLRIGPLVGSP